MTLSEQLNEQRAKANARIPADKQAIMHRATEDLQKSGLIDKVPKVGDTAPDFSLEDAEGNPVSLHALLASGPVVLSFFRGQW